MKTTIFSLICKATPLISALLSIIHTCASSYCPPFASAPRSASSFSWALLPPHPHHHHLFTISQTSSPAPSSPSLISQIFFLFCCYNCLWTGSKPENSAVAHRSLAIDFSRARCPLKGFYDFPLVLLQAKTCVQTSFSTGFIKGQQQLISETKLRCDYRIKLNSLV